MSDPVAFPIFRTTDPVLARRGAATATARPSNPQLVGDTSPAARRRMTVWLSF
ncbi:hypothetical protein ACFW6M_25295 [Streptomyces nigra]|uniref:hypothetical protein n=1 Tax=Streptomyces nigra TaxID=1827580 RepID=UPI0036912B89